MKLLNILFWLEMRRLKIHVILLGLVLVMAGIWLGLDSGLDLTNVDINLELENEDKDFVDKIQQFMSLETLIQLIPLWIILILASGAGLVVMIVTPFRSQAEWAQGQFQMLRMSRWSPYQIQAARFLLYFVLTWGFYTILGFLVALGVQVAGIDMPGHSFDIIISSQVISLTLCPIVIATGMTVDSLATAYYQKGSRGPILILQFVGWIILGSLASDFFEAAKNTVLPPVELKSLDVFENVIEHPINLYLEPIFLSLLLSAGLVTVSGQVLREVEA